MRVCMSIHVCVSVLVLVRGHANGNVELRIAAAARVSHEYRAVAVH